jgi:hypothetical protein
MRSPSVITIECCGLLVGSTSEEIAEHIKESWLTGELSTLRVCILGVVIDCRGTTLTVLLPVGQRCIDLLRDELGTVDADVYAPITLGGVQLHKLQGSMHDTCNTANKTARLVKGLRATSGQLYYGFDEWESKAAEDKPWFDFLCGNHTRNLPMDAFNKVDLLDFYFFFYWNCL